MPQLVGACEFDTELLACLSQCTRRQEGGAPAFRRAAVNTVSKSVMKFETSVTISMKCLWEAVTPLPRYG